MVKHNCTILGKCKVVLNWMAAPFSCFWLLPQWAPLYISIPCTLWGQRGGGASLTKTASFNCGTISEKWSSTENWEDFAVIWLWSAYSSPCHPQMLIKAPSCKEEALQEHCSLLGTKARFKWTEAKWRTVVWSKSEIPFGHQGCIVLYWY